MSDLGGDWRELLARVDWARPWLHAFSAEGVEVAKAWAGGQALHQSLNAVLGASCPVRFVPQGALGERMPYEMHVAQHNQVPTREQLHDFFNGLAWAAWPHLKARFNTLHAQALAADASEARARGPLRDALTLWDENGAMLIAPPALWMALRQHDWHTLFVTQRGLWAQARLWLVGHALMEQLVNPRKGLTAHVWLMPEAENAQALALLQTRGEAAARRWVDARVGEALRAEDLNPKPFTPLPVLGVPGWCADNREVDFYADASVFRPLRKEAPQAVRWVAPT